jgi:hypothetical protein
LARSTVYKATKSGLVGVSPMKMGPAPKIPEKFMALVATLRKSAKQEMAN